MIARQVVSLLDVNFGNGDASPGSTRVCIHTTPQLMQKRVPISLPSTVQDRTDLFRFGRTTLFIINATQGFLVFDGNAGRISAGIWQLRGPKRPRHGE